MPKVEFEKATNTAILGEESLVFHCHHYNCTLQKAVQDGVGEGAAALLSSAAIGPAFRQLEAFVREGAKRTEILALADQTFGEVGFGRLEFSGMTRAGGDVTLRSSHYAMGWSSLFGESKTPVCHFAVGFVTAAVAVAFELTPASIHVEETACFACGASDDCRLRVEVRS